MDEIHYLHVIAGSQVGIPWPNWKEGLLELEVMLKHVLTTVM